MRDLPFDCSSSCSLLFYYFLRYMIHQAIEKAGIIDDIWAMGLAINCIETKLNDIGK